MAQVTPTTNPNTTSFANETSSMQTTTAYPNDVTWESVGKYVHLFNQCWSYTPVRGYTRGREPEKCDLKNDKTIADQNINYPCTALKADFPIYIEKVQQLNENICPRSNLVKDFDNQVRNFERYDDANYINSLLTAGTSISGAVVVIALFGAFMAATAKMDTPNTEGESCASKYWLSISLLSSAVFPTIFLGINSAALANDDKPAGDIDCYEYHILQDMGHLAQNVTGIDYL